MTQGERGIMQMQCNGKYMRTKPCCGLGKWNMTQGELFHDLWKHVSVEKCLMATQAHDIWLILGRERSNVVRK